MTINSNSMSRAYLCSGTQLTRCAKSVPDDTKLKLLGSRRSGHEIVYNFSGEGGSVRFYVARCHSCERWEHTIKNIQVILADQIRSTQTPPTLSEALLGSLSTATVLHDRSADHEEYHVGNSRTASNRAGPHQGWFGRVRSRSRSRTPT